MNTGTEHMWSLRISEKVYRALLWAYPTGFRQLYADEMAADFCCCYRDALASSSGETPITLWARVILDLISSATAERLRQAGYRSTAMIDTTQFDSQLAATVDYWSRAMRRGYSIRQVFSLIAERGPEPTASIMRETLSDAETSGDFLGALARMAERVPSKHLTHVLAAVARQRETGDNLADVLDEINTAMRAELGSDGWSEHLTFDD